MAELRAYPVLRQRMAKDPMAGLRAYRELRRRRDCLICAARLGGRSERAIASAAGISKSRVHEILSSR